MTEAQPPTGPWGDAEAWTPPPGPEQPQSIRLAVRLMWVGAGLTAIGVISTFFQRDAIRDAIEDSDDTLTADELDTAVNVGMTISVVIGLIGVGLWLWMANTNGQGKAWARTVATVLGGLNVLSALLNVAGGQMTAVTAIFTAISLALAVSILILLYRPDANAFYDANAPR